MIRIASLCRVVSIAVLVALGTGTISAAPQAEPGSSADAQKLVYRVQHSTYGTIGTYTNAIQKTGETTVVTTEAAVRVAILGITMFRQNASRTERWSGDRLVSFKGVTKTNDRTVEWSGEAEGDRFVVMSANGGENEVPGTVRVANPWSGQVLKGNIMLTPDRGVLEQVEIKGGEDTMVDLEKGSVAARHYLIERSDRAKSYEVWFDKGDKPVKFAVNNPNGVVTFTLING